MTRSLLLGATVVAAIVGCGCDSDTTAPTRLVNVVDFSPGRATTPRPPSPTPLAPIPAGGEDLTIR